MKDNANFSNNEAAEVSGETVSFSFGANWLNFLEKLDQDRIQKARDSFCNFTRMDSLAGHHFLDIGCGSGLSSLVALSLGASQVTSIDVDPNSIAACIKLKSQFPQFAESWVVRQGSVLDAHFVETLPKASFVYSWGVLHHTGNMWAALDQVKNLISTDGYLYIAIYNSSKQSEFWLRVKRVYNTSPRVGKTVLELGFAVFAITVQLCKFKNPWRYIRTYNQSRGMSWYSDIIDWLGGLPYEYARPEEILHYLHPEGFDLHYMATTHTIGCNEFLFRKNQK